MLTQRLHLVLVAASALGSRAEAPSCAETGYGYKGTTLTVNGGFPEDASACQALCAQQTSCSFFTYYTDSKACWLLGGEAVRGQDASTSVSGPKECQPVFSTTQALLDQVAPNAVVVQAPATPAPLPQSVTLGPATAPTVVTVTEATAASSTTFLAATEAPATTTTEASANITAAAAAVPATNITSGTATVAADEPATVAADEPEVKDAESAVDIRATLHTWGWAVMVLALVGVAVACTFCNKGPAKGKTGARRTRGLEFQGQIERLEEKIEADTAPLMTSEEPYVMPMAPLTYAAAPAPMYVTRAPTVVTTPSISIAPASVARSVVVPAPASASVAMPVTTAEFGGALQGGYAYAKS